jgi:hypothetical protein
MKPCGHLNPRLPNPWSPDYCRICLLYETNEAYRALWDGQLVVPNPEGSPELEGRKRPCLFLGEVLDKLDCPCPGQWLRKCKVLGTCNIQACKACKNYQESLE